MKISFSSFITTIESRAMTLFQNLHGMAFIKWRNKKNTFCVMLAVINYIVLIFLCVDGELEVKKHQLRFEESQWRVQWSSSVLAPLNVDMCIFMPITVTSLELHSPATYMLCQSLVISSSLSRVTQSVDFNQPYSPLPKWPVSLLCFNKQAKCI